MVNDQPTRIAWVTHHVPVDDTGGGQWIPGRFRGGAELSDWEYRQAAPPSVHIDIFSAIEWEWAMDYDRVVITGTDELTDTAMRTLATTKPMVFLHHQQTRTPARKALLDSALPLVCHSPAHLERETSWCEPSKTRLVLSALDTNLIHESPKEHFALWAARNHPEKGLGHARIWAHAAGIPLVVMHDQPRERVLETMARAETFVHLPTTFHPEERTVVEAVLSGCRVHTNSNAGITSFERWNDGAWLKAEVDAAGRRFWDTVLNP